MTILINLADDPQVRDARGSGATLAFDRKGIALPMTGTSRYRSEIDGLRAIAVGSVILNHFNPAFAPSGYLGVDIFFVISGYVISLSLCTRELGNLTKFLLDFYARRFKRLMPALIVCVVVTSILISLVNAAPDQSLRSGFFALFGLSNLYLLRIANDYFGSPSQLNSFTHTWSLGVEEQFYVIYPIILWLVLQRSPRHRFMILGAIICTMAMASVALFAHFGTSQPMMSFYLMPLRFWEMATGCLVAIVHHQRGYPARIKRRWAENILLILIVVTLFLPQHLALFTNISVVALTAAALAILSPGSSAHRLLTSRLAIYLGLMSYSLYLWHWPILVIGRHTIGVHWWSVPILAILVGVIAHVSFHYVERPLRKQKWAVSSGRTVLVGGAAVFIAAGLVAILAGPLDGRLYSGQRAQLAERNVESLTDAYRIPGTRYDWAGATCVLATNADLGRIIPLDACTLGRFNEAQHRVMVFGNSFSAAYVGGFDTLVKDDHYAVTITSAWGASPLADVPNDSAWSRTNAYYWGTILPGMVSRLRPGDWVLLISDLSGFAPQSTGARQTQELALYKSGLRRLSAKLMPAGIRLAVLDANPFIRDSDCRPEAALPQWFAPGGGPCKFFTKTETIVRRQEIDTVLRQLQREHRLVVIDPIDVFCPGQTCSYVGNHDHVLYRDEYSHPSVEAARDTAPLFRHVLTSAAGLP